MRNQDFTQHTRSHLINAELYLQLWRTSINTVNMEFFCKLPVWALAAMLSINVAGKNIP